LNSSDQQRGQHRNNGYGYSQQPEIAPNQSGESETRAV
jgi:hypothetical protein